MAIATKRPRLNPRLRQGVKAVVSLAVVAAIFMLVVGRFADFSDVVAAITTLTWREVVVLGVATAWNLVTYWIVVVLATPGLTYPQSAVVTQSTTAVANVSPAGSAVGIGLSYTILSSWGFSRSWITLSVAVTGIWDTFVKMAMPIAALAILAVQGEPEEGQMVVAVAGLAGLVVAVVVFALILQREEYARKVGLTAERWVSSLRRIVRRGPVTGWDHAVIRFRARVIGLVRRRWLALTATALVSHLSLYAVLLISLRVMGVSDDEVGWAQVLAVFSFARLLTAIPLTPGGVGVIELALIAGLVGAGGEDAQVVASVLLYRLLTYLAPTVLGLGTYIYWRRNRSWLGSAPPLSPEFTPATQGAS